MFAADIDVPVEAYRERAANREEPYLIGDDIVISHDLRLGRDFAASGLCFFSDVSKYQSKPYDATYPYPVASFRFHSGTALDVLASANWSYLRGAITAGHIRVAVAYVVFIPGQLATVMAGIHALFGATCPTNRLALMIDMESGAGFAGPGNHSAEANQWAQAFATYTGTGSSWARVIGYANAGDWASNWPQRDARLKRITAAYNAKDPSPWGWQYAGGNPAYPVPPGYPRTAAPWSSTYIDMNVVNYTIDELEQQLEITAPVTKGADDMPLLIFSPDLRTVGEQGWSKDPSKATTENPQGYTYWPTFTNEQGIHWIPNTELVALDTLVQSGDVFMLGAAYSWDDCRVLMLDKYGPGGQVALPTGTDLGEGPGVNISPSINMVPLPGTPPTTGGVDLTAVAAAAKQGAAAALNGATVTTTQTTDITSTIGAPP